jgi:hypothetical protein
MSDLNPNRYYVYAHYKTGEENIPFYIGFGSGRRANSRGKRNKHWHSVVNKYGFYSKKLCEHITKAEAKQLEIKLIGMFGRSDTGAGPLVNKTDGGDQSNGRKFQKGHVPSNKGKKMSEDQKEKYRKAGFWKGYKRKGTKQAPFGEIARLNMSNAHIGQNTWSKGRIWIHDPLTMDARTIDPNDNIPSGWVVGARPRTTEQIENNRTAQIKATENRKAVGIPHGNVGKKKCGGYVWIHNPITSERTRIKPTEVIPSGWIRGWGSKK